MTDSLSRVIDLKKLRDDDAYRSGIIRKGIDSSVLDDVLVREETCRKLQQEVEELRSEQNVASKEIGQASPEDRTEKIAAASAIKELLQAKETAYASASEGLQEITISLPNPANERCPDGGEDDYEVVEVIGECPEAPIRNHAEYGEIMG